MPEYLLAIDFGTSYFKTALLDERGRVCRIDRVPTPIAHHADRSEIHPHIFRQTVRDSIAALARHNALLFQQVKAITFCTQANTFTLLDAADQPLTPLIVWNDRRADAMGFPSLTTEETEAHRRISGIPQLGPAFAVAKLRWLARFSPEVCASARKLLFMGDYFAHWLTGQHVTETSVAALSGLYDVERNAWSEPWCDRFGIKTGWLPEIVRPGTPLGVIQPGAADELGLPLDCIFVMGILDQYAGAIGVGNDAPGNLSETTGTVLATVRGAATFLPPGDAQNNLQIFSGPGVEPGMYYHMAFGDVSASLLEYYREQLPDRPEFAELDALPEPLSPRLHLDPHLSTEALREQLRQWAANESRGAVVASIYNRVAHALAEQVDQLLGGENPPHLIRSAGGASRSRRWLQMKADALGIPVLAPANTEPTLLGVAALAARALNWPPICTSSDDVEPSRLIRPMVSSRLQ